MKTIHLSIIVIFAICFALGIGVAYAQYGSGFYPPEHYPPTNDTKLELVVMNSTEFKERTTGYNYTLAGIDYNWIPKGNNYYEFGGARVTFLVWGFGNATTKGESFNLDPKMKIKSVFEFDANRPPAGYPSSTCEGICRPWVNPAKPLTEPKTIELPLEQFKSGISLEDIQCEKPLVLFFKTEDHSPVCLTIGTADVLSRRNVIDTSDNTILDVAKKKARDFILSSITFETFGLKSSLSLNSDALCLATFPADCLVKGNFDAIRSGYGNGTNSFSEASKTTHHTFAIRINDTNNVMCAVIDGIWDEKNQKPLDKSDGLCGYLYGLKGGLP